MPALPSWLTEAARAGLVRVVAGVQMRGPVVGQRPAVVQAVQVQGRRCSRVSAVWVSEVSSVWRRPRRHRPGRQRWQSNRQVGKAHCRPLRSRPWPVCASGTPGHRARPVRDTVRGLSPNGGSEGTRAALGSCRHRRGGERDAELEEALSGLRIVKEDGGDRRTSHDCGLHRADSTTAAVRSSAAVRTSWQGRPSRSSGSARERRRSIRTTSLCPKGGTHRCPDRG